MERFILTRARLQSAIYSGEALHPDVILEDLEQEGALVRIDHIVEKIEAAREQLTKADTSAHPVGNLIIAVDQVCEALEALLKGSGGQRNG